MAVLESAAELQQYCLRKLGAPIINIEVAQVQLDDRTDEALDLFIQRHYDGVTEVYVKYIITARDVANGYITPPPNLVSITELIDTGISGQAGSSAEAFNRLNYRLAQSDFFDTFSTNMSEFYIKKQSMATAMDVLNTTRNFQFNYTRQYLQTSGKFIENNFIILHGYEAIDLERNVNVYNDEWVKKFATALIGMQWGQNSRKYDGVQLPGGVSMNGQALYDGYKEDLDALLEKFELKYELPVDFIMAPSYM